MALVALLRGVNVGGHKTFRPSSLAGDLQRYGFVNIGAAGTFVIRKPIGRERLRAEILRRLPFEATVMICDGQEIRRLVSSDPFAGQPSGPKIVRFVSVAEDDPRSVVPVPLSLPSSTSWRLRVLQVQGRFVLGLYRREMKAIGYLSRLDKILGTPLTTRNWNTILSISRILDT